MLKIHENAGRLALMNRNNAHAAKNFPEAEQLLKDEVKNYSQTGNSDVVRKNLEETCINLSASLIAQNKLDEAINVLKNAVDKMNFRSAEFNNHFAVAYYNLGLQQKVSNLDDAILSFTSAKHYEPYDANILYNLVLALLKKGEHDKAKTEFEYLLFKDTQIKCSLELQINSYCKLIECQFLLVEDIEIIFGTVELLFDKNEFSCTEIELHKLEEYNKFNRLDNDIDNVLRSASKIFSQLDPQSQVRHKEEAVFIYSRLIGRYLVTQDHESAKNAFKLIEANIPGIAKDIVWNLKQYALHLYNTGSQKDAITMLFALAHVPGEIIDNSFLETIKADLASMSDKLDKGLQSEEFTLKVLGDIENCNYDAIDDLLQ